MSVSDEPNRDAAKSFALRLAPVNGINVAPSMTRNRSRDHETSGESTMAGTKLQPELVDKLLDKLGSDDHFRSAFTKDPKAALQSIGASADVQCGGCMSPKQLASKDQFKRSRGKFRDAMLGQSSHEVFNLEA